MASKDSLQKHTEMISTVRSMMKKSTKVYKHAKPARNKHRTRTRRMSSGVTLRTQVNWDAGKKARNFAPKSRAEWAASAEFIRHLQKELQLCSSFRKFWSYLVLFNPYIRRQDAEFKAITRLVMCTYCTSQNSKFILLILSSSRPLTPAFTNKLVHV